MRLLNVYNEDITDFTDPTNVPDYIIASHRWFETEISLKEFEQIKKIATHGHRDSDSWKKIEGFLKYVKQNFPEIEWLWIDTCCIDRGNLRERSEAVNSMFDWYRNARLCVAYLRDVEADDWEKSIWFSRGWTLQELLAPNIVIFVTRTWQTIGSKTGIASHVSYGPKLESKIAKITGIPKSVLHNFEASSAMRFDEKLKWMDGRETLWPEDMSYALFGIFGVQPGTTYSEGSDNARRRLERAILEKDALDVLQAVAQTDKAKVDHIVRRQPDAIFYSNEKGQTTLHLAVLAGNIEMIKHLISCKVQINRGDYQGRHPLHYATEADDCAVVKLLLDHKADVLVRDRHGHAPANICKSELARWLIQHGSDLTRQIGHRPALPHFAYCGDERTVRSLLKMDIDLECANHDGHSALFEALIWRHMSIVRLLLDHGANVHTRNNVSSTPMHSVGEDGSSELGEVLLDYGADINATNVKLMTPLHLACVSDRPHTVSMLLQRQAKCDLFNIDGMAPIHLAAKYGRFAVLPLLLNQGDDVERTTKDGHWTPLALAATNGHDNCVRELIYRGADIEAQVGADLKTALILAAESGHRDAMRVLLDHGARTDAADRGGQTALHWAASRGHLEATKMILSRKVDLDSRDAEGRTALCRAAQTNNFKTGEHLIMAGADLNARDVYGASVLAEASYHGAIDFVRFLVDQGADINSRDLVRCTPLIRSAMACHQAIAITLAKSAKVDLDACNRDQWTALTHACFAGQSHLVEELLGRGANKSIKTVAGQTPRDVAKRFGHDRIVQILDTHKESEKFM